MSSGYDPNQDKTLWELTHLTDGRYPVAVSIMQYGNTDEKISLHRPAAKFRKLGRLLPKEAVAVVGGLMMAVKESLDRDGYDTTEVAEWIRQATEAWHSTIDIAVASGKKEPPKKKKAPKKKPKAATKPTKDVDTVHEVVSPTSGSTYTVTTYVDGSYWCTCQAFKFSKKAVEDRQCKHVHAVGNSGGAMINADVRRIDNDDDEQLPAPKPKRNRTKRRRVSSTGETPKVPKRARALAGIGKSRG